MDVVLDSFVGIVHGVLDKIAPMRDVRVKQKTEPWMTPDILAGIRLRNQMLKKYKKKKDQALFEQYCSVRNRVQRDIKLTKKFYLKGEIEQNRKEPKKLWNQLKSLGCSSKVVSNAETILELDGEKCFDKEKVSKCFN